MVPVKLLRLWPGSGELERAEGRSKGVRARLRDPAHASQASLSLR